MTFLPANCDMAELGTSRSEVKHAVTYIANEFLENAMKYHARDVDIPIGLRRELPNDKITITVSNGVCVEHAILYKSFIESILNKDAGDLLLQQFEENSSTTDSSRSCLGLLTMMSDYRAQLGWRFETHPEFTNKMIVRTTAVLPLKTLGSVSA